MIFGMNLCTYMKVQRTFCSAIPDGFWRSGSWKNYNKQKSTVQPEAMTLGCLCTCFCKR